MSLILLAVLVVLGQPTGPVPGVPGRAPLEVTADEVAPLSLDALPLILWIDGEVRARAGQGATALAPVIGDALDVGHSLELATNGRVALLASGERLVVLRGPGFWRMTRGALETANGEAPRVEVLSAYREGPLPTLEPASSQPLDAELGLAATLAFVAPAGPVVRLAPTEVRWHWPHDGGRFDLLVTRSEADGASVVVERWSGLAGRRHVLWTRLEPGADYRFAIALATSGVASSAIFDTRAVRVLAPSELAAVEGALSALDLLLAESRRYRPEYDVLRARLLESYGLWGDAQAVWTGLSVLHPERVELFHRAVRLHRRQQGG